MPEGRVINLRDVQPTHHLGPDGRFVKSRILPDDVVVVDRRSRWGNPYRIGTFRIAGAMTREASLTAFVQYAAERLQREPDWLEPLRGKRLACWCVPQACHADILLALLDAGES